MQGSNRATFWRVLGNHQFGLRFDAAHVNVGNGIACPKSSLYGSAQSSALLGHRRAPNYGLLLDVCGQSPVGDNSTPSAQRGHLSEMAALFLRLGFIAFGGPAADIAMMRDEVVRRRHWMSDQQFSIW
jgi:Chromate transporter